MIEITDEETSDLLSHLDEAVQFIEGFDCHTLNTNNIRYISQNVWEKLAEEYWFTAGMTVPGVPLSLVTKDCRL